jgi:hypothetical protein
MVNSIIHKIDDLGTASSPSRTTATLLRKNTCKSNRSVLPLPPSKRLDLCTYSCLLTIQIGEEIHCFVPASNNVSSQVFHSRRTMSARSADLGTILAAKISGMHTKPCVNFS